MLNSQNVSKKEKILSKIIFSFCCDMKNINKKDSNIINTSYKLIHFQIS